MSKIRIMNWSESANDIYILIKRVLEVKPILQFTGIR